MSSASGLDRAGLVAPGLTNGLGVFFERTANANEFRMRATNSDALTARTHRWAPDIGGPNV